MKWIIAIIAVEAIVEIWLESPLFDDIRIWLGGKGKWLNELIGCGWCLSVWIAGIAFALLYFGLWWILALFAVHRLANFVHDILMLIRRFKHIEIDE